MTTFQRMCAQLKPTGLYRLDGTTLVEAELAAYAGVLDALLAELDELLEEGFLDVTDGAFFSGFEILFGLPVTMDDREEDPQAVRQEKMQLMKRRLAVRNTDFYPQAIREQLEQGGITAQLTEQPQSRQVAVTITADKGYYAKPQDKERFIRRVMPCHVKPVIDFLEENA